MTDDKRNLDPDPAVEQPEAGLRPAGLVYLVPSPRPSHDHDSDRDNVHDDLDDLNVDEDNPGDGHPGRGKPGDGNVDHLAAGDADTVAAETDDGGVGEDAPVREGGRAPAGEDWPWVVEWRAGGESTPWATGVALAVFAALVVGVAVWVLSAGLADRPIVALLVNLLVAGGLAPAMWLSKDLPVLRWIAAGTLVGIVGGWIAALMMLPMPAV
jgi:hypothetical protein